jgi:hypothetical protein
MVRFITIPLVQDSSSCRVVNYDFSLNVADALFAADRKSEQENRGRTHLHGPTAMHGGWTQLKTSRPVEDASMTPLS